MNAFVLCFVVVRVVASSHTGERVRAFNSSGKLIYDVPARWAHLFPRRPSMLISEDVSNSSSSPAAQIATRPPANSLTHDLPIQGDSGINNLGNNLGNSSEISLMNSLPNLPAKELEDRLRSILLVGATMVSLDANFARYSDDFSHICDSNSELIISIVTRHYLDNWVNRFKLLRAARLKMIEGNREAAIRGLWWLITPFWNLDAICPNIIDEKIYRIINLQRIFRQMFIVENRGTFFPRAVIDRKRILESSATQLFNGNFLPFWALGEIGGIYVNYLGENGMDFGGVFVDWITSIGRALVAEKILVPTEDEGAALTINSERNISEHNMNFFGVILGLAVLHDAYIGIPISVGLFKYLIGEKVALADLKHEFPQLYRNLYELDSTISTDIYFMAGDYELMPGGSGIVVTEANLAEFQTAMSEWKMVRSFEKQFEQIKNGFVKIMGSNYREQFSPSMTGLQMQRIFCGKIADPPIEEFLKIIRWHCNEISSSDCQDQKSRMEAFFVILSSVEKVGDFLNFVTATRIFNYRPIDIIFENFPDSDNRFPSVGTCVRSITIPNYSSDSIFDSQMMLALNDTGSREFGLH